MIDKPSPRAVLGALALSTSAVTGAATVTVDCNAGGGIGLALDELKPGDVLLVQGTCRENVVISSHNSFGRIVDNAITRNRQGGILVLGSASAHIGVVRSDDQRPRPNVIQDNEGDGVNVIRASTARVIGNTLSGSLKGRSGAKDVDASCKDRSTR